MMAILIKGMEMPETCDECDFHIYHSNGEYICVATPLLYPWNLANYKGGRKDWCPLVEVQDAQTEKKTLNGDVIFRQATCEYCYEDFEGYVKPIEKNCHAFIRFGMNGWELSLKANGWHGSAKIRYCPMCGRDLLVKLGRKDEVSRNDSI